MPQIAVNSENPQNDSRSDQALSGSADRKPWVKPAASVEQVRDVTARSPGGVRLDGGGSGSCLS